MTPWKSLLLIFFLISWAAQAQELRPGTVIPVQKLCPQGREFLSPINPGPFASRAPEVWSSHLLSCVVDRENGESEQVSYLLSMIFTQPGPVASYRIERTFDTRQGLDRFFIRNLDREGGLFKSALIPMHSSMNVMGGPDAKWVALFTAPGASPACKGKREFFSSLAAGTPVPTGFCTGELSSEGNVHPAPDGSAPGNLLDSEEICVEKGDDDFLCKNFKVRVVLATQETSPDREAVRIHVFDLYAIDASVRPIAQFDADILGDVGCGIQQVRIIPGTEKLVVTSTNRLNVVSIAPGSPRIEKDLVISNEQPICGGGGEPQWGFELLRDGLLVYSREKLIQWTTTGVKKRILWEVRY